MNLIEQKLSAMQVGTPVRFTTENGQVIEGVVAENDGAEALSVQISSIATIRYSQISAIEINSDAVSAPITAPVSSAPISAPKAPPESDKREILMSCSEYDVRNAFKKMDGDSRKILNPVLSKIQSAIKSHESDKLKDAAELCWNLMQDNGLENNPDSNVFYAYVCFLNEEYYYSSVSFYIAGDLRNAYRAAFCGAEKGGTESLYLNSAAFSAIYIAENQSEYLDEAVKVLMISSEKRNDISGVKFVVSSNINGNIKFALWDAVRYLAKMRNYPLMNLSDLSKCIEELEPYYTQREISDEIRIYSQDAQAEEDTVQESAPEPKEWYNGTLDKYSIFDGRGTITDVDGAVFCYELDDIADASLRNQLKKILSKKDFSPVEVLFKPARKMSKDYAVEIKRFTPYVPKPVKPDPNKLFMSGKYEEAIELLREKADTPEWDDAFSLIIQCYLALWNKNGDLGYTNELEALTDKYADSISKTAKNLEVLQQYYMKVHKFSKCIEVINSLLEACDRYDYNGMLHYILCKERCYRNLKDYQSAIGQLQDWLDIVKKNKITERYELRQNTVFIELAELYFEIGDYENAEKFANDSTCSEERKQALLDKISALRESDDSQDEEYSAEEDDEAQEDSTAITLREAYDEYADEEVIDLTDADIAEKLPAFDEKHLYCLLAWLSAASKISAKNIASGDSALNSGITAAQAIQSIESAFSYAYNNPLADCDYTSSQIISLYEVSKKLIPQYNDGLMASAMLRTVFSPSSGQDYNLDDLIVVVQESQLSEKYPTLANLLTEMKSFYENTGYGIDLFAGYRSNENVIDEVVKEAGELCASLDGKNVVYENQGQVRRLRELMFSDERSELRKCLNIAAENNVSEIRFVRGTMERLFIRSNKPLTAENADSSKIDSFINIYWDKARDIILSEGRH
ncbi:MAG: tetratricopeptide repeat protein, partial [Oscillospiraceae bacterium]